MFDKKLFFYFLPFGAKVNHPLEFPADGVFRAFDSFSVIIPEVHIQRV